MELIKIKQNVAPVINLLRSQPKARRSIKEIASLSGHSHSHVHKCVKVLLAQDILILADIVKRKHGGPSTGYYALTDHGLKADIEYQPNYVRTNPAKVTHRTVSSCTEQKKKRPCLSCKKKFESEWIGNRICTKCTPKNEANDAGEDFSDTHAANGRVVPRSKGCE